MKRKCSMAMAIALAVMLLVGTGLAAGLKLNLFEYFSQSEDAYRKELDQQKLVSLQDKDTLISTSVTDIPQGLTAEDLDKMNDAYYDGEVLFVSFIIGESLHTVEWTPTAEDIAQHAVPSAIRTNDYMPINLEAQARIEQAFETGQPYGFKQYLRSTDFTRLETAGGERLWHRNENYFSQSIGNDRYYGMMQVMSPLPEEIRHQDTIEIRLPMQLSTIYYWYDGEELYMWYDNTEQAMLTAVIARDTDVPHGQYESETATVDDTLVTVEASASPYLLHVVIRPEEPIFHSTDRIWEWHIYDDSGHELMKSYEKLIIYGSVAPRPILSYVHEYGADGLSRETWLELPGEMPETITVVITEGMEERASYTLRLAE